MSRSNSSNNLEFISVPQHDDESAYAMHTGGGGGAAGGVNGLDGSSSGGFGGALDYVMGSTILRHSKHPMAAIFHLLFKVLLYIYMYPVMMITNTPF